MKWQCLRVLDHIQQKRIDSVVNVIVEILVRLFINKVIVAKYQFHKKELNF